MMHTLMIYSAYQYGTITAVLLAEKFKEEFPYMSGYGIAIMIPDKIINRESIAPGLLSPHINQGMM